MTVAIRTTALSKRYGRHLALDDCTLTIPHGRIVGLVGPNGAGKSTLLGLMSGMVAPTPAPTSWPGSGSSPRTPRSTPD